MTELLAPAGNMEAFYAAILNGADAVYLGGKNFSARAFAENFDDSALSEVIRVAHFHGKKVYITVNTLVDDAELTQALEDISHWYLLGLDGLIIQDVGLLYRLRQIMPDLPLHASTQMTINNSLGAEFCIEQGMKRLILARELSFADIAAIKQKTGADLEVFVHGALCICYSGQCLFSSMVGGRSGNRGRCAQPCRMGYTLVNHMGDPVTTEVKGNYLLSPRDLVGFPEIEALHELGVKSWKIEGRMKKPEYVATVCRIYSHYLQLLDQNRVIYPTDEDMRQLLQVFNRDHGAGYWHGNPGTELMSFSRPNNRGVFLGRITEVGGGFILIKLEQPLAIGDGLDVWVSGGGGHEGFTVTKILLGEQPVESAQAGDVVAIPAKSGRSGDRVFKTFDAPLIALARESYAHMEEKKVDFTIKAKRGQALEISAIDADGMTAKTISEYIVIPARTSISDWYSIHAQLDRLGGSGFCFGSLDGELDDDIMIPASVLNHCRRDLTTKLMQKHWLSSGQRTVNRQALTQANLESAAARPKPVNPRLAVLTDDESTALAAARHGIMDIYVDVEGFRGKKKIDCANLNQKLKPYRARLIPYLPQIIAEKDVTDWQNRISSWQESGLSAVVINNLGQLKLAEGVGWQGALYAGTGMNVFNGSSGRFLAELGVSRIALSQNLCLPIHLHTSKGTAS
ncbi:MAG: U32 family peptidase [Clostridiales bacterium]